LTTFGPPEFGSLGRRKRRPAADQRRLMVGEKSKIHFRQLGRNYDGVFGVAKDFFRGSWAATKFRRGKGISYIPPVSACIRLMLIPRLPAEFSLPDNWHSPCVLDCGNGIHRKARSEQALVW